VNKIIGFPTKNSSVFKACLKHIPHLTISCGDGGCKPEEMTMYEARIYEICLGGLKCNNAGLDAAGEYKWLDLNRK